MSETSRIRHFVANRPTSVVACLKEHFSLEEPQARELLKLGAIYHNKKRVFSDMPLAEKAYLRVHLMPRRFPIDEVDWKRVVLHEEKEFLVVNKPPGIPVHASLDNQRENVLEQLRDRLNMKLFVTHRLDLPVSGVMVYAKTPEFQTRFNKWLAERKVTKIYLARTKDPAPVGRHLHYMEPVDRSPRKFIPEALSDWIACELSVLSTERKDRFFESRIELHTGRTHQIRGQLQALGCPILGDKFYGSRDPYPGGKNEQIGLFSTILEWPNPATWPAKTSWRFELLPS